MHRERVARLVAPAVPAILLLVVPPLLTGSWEPLYGIASIVPGSLAVGYGVFLGFGLPLVALLSRHDRATWLTLGLGGLCLGAVVGLVFYAGLGLLLGTLAYGDLRTAAETALWGAGFGLTVGIAYRGIAGPMQRL
jgi:hypothetical protein